MSRGINIYDLKNRKITDLINDKSYHFDNHYDTGIHKETRQNGSSVQFTKLRNRNTNFNPPHYGKSNIIQLRREFDVDTEEKKECNNAYPFLTKQQQNDTIPNVIIGRNASRTNDSSSISNGMANNNRGLIRTTQSEFIKSKVPMKQTSGNIY